MSWTRRKTILALAALAFLIASAAAVQAKLQPTPVTFGGAGTDDGLFQQPGGLAFTSNGDIWVADTGNARLQRFNAGGAVERVIGGFIAPTSVAVGPDDAVYVADRGADRIVKLLPDGTVDASFLQNSLSGVRAVAVDPRGDSLYAVADSGRLDEVSTATGVATQVLTTSLTAPTSVAVDASGLIAVAEPTIDKIFVFDPDKSTSSSFGNPGSDAQELNDPQGVAFDPYGLIVVADTGNGRIQRFTTTGAVQDELDGLGTPVAVASDDIQSFAIVDSSQSRVVFGQDVLPPPILGQTANVARLDGTVTIRDPDGGASHALRSPLQIRLGSDINATDNGIVRLVTARSEGGTQQATLSLGQFTIRQPAGLPIATLSGNQLKSCPKAGVKGSTARLPSPDPPTGQPKRVVRTRVKGHFRTNGSAASADVKGTDYEVADFCTGTRITVFVGVVKVTRLSDGHSALVSGTRARPGVLFVKGRPKPAKKKAKTGRAAE